MAPTPGCCCRWRRSRRATVTTRLRLSEPAIPSPEGTPAHAPAEGSEAPADPAPAPAARYDRDRLTDRLLGLVSQRTGYPKDMLGLDVDLEADLGIDSIKRIEILSEVTTDLGTDVQSMATELEMEKLTVIRTLRGIIDYLDDALSSPPIPIRPVPLLPHPTSGPRGPTGPLRSGARSCRSSAPWWTWSIAPSSHLPTPC